MAVLSNALKEEIHGIVSRAGLKELLPEFIEHLPENGNEIIPLIFKVLNNE